MMSSRSWRFWCVLPLVGALFGVAGCAADSATIESPDPTEGGAQSPLAKEAAPPLEARGPRDAHAHRHHGPPGPEHLLFEALHELDLTDAQRTAIKGAIATLPSPKDRGPEGTARKDRGVFAALASGIRAGKIDEAAVLAAAPARPDAARRDAVAGAMQTLHATLTPEQRQALVDRVTARIDAHGTKGDHHGMKGDHHGMKGDRHGMKGDRHERKGDRHERKGDRGPRGARAERGGKLGHLLAGLDLTDTQRASIQRALEAQRPPEAEREAMKDQFKAFHAEMRARLSTFAGESFDAKAFVTPPQGAEAMGPKGHLGRMVKDLSVIVPLLEPAQREKLAEHFEKGPPAPMDGPDGP